MVCLKTDKFHTTVGGNDGDKVLQDNKIINFDGAIQYAHRNIDLRKELGMLFEDLKKGKGNYTYEELTSKANDYFKGFVDAGSFDGAFKGASENIDVDSLKIKAKGGDQLKDDLTIRKEKIDGIINALGNYNNDPLKVIADFNRKYLTDNFFNKEKASTGTAGKILGIKPDSKESIDSINTLTEAIREKAGLNTAGHFVNRLVNDVFGNGFMYIGGQLVIGIATGTYGSIIGPQGTVAAAMVKMFDLPEITTRAETSVIMEALGLFDPNETRVGKKTSLKNIKKRIGNTYVGKVFPGVYNVIDVGAANYVHHASLQRVLNNSQFFQFHGDVNAFLEYFVNLKKTNVEQYDKELIEFRKMFFKEVDGAEGSMDRLGTKFRTGGKNIRGFKKIMSGVNTFLASRGIGKLQAANRAFKEADLKIFSKSKWQQYAEIYEEAGPIEAMRMISNVYSKNESLIKVIDSFVHALGYARWAEREQRQESGEEDRSTNETVKNIFELSTLFSGDLDAINTIPRMRAVKNAFGYALASADSPYGTPTDKAITASTMSVVNRFKEMGKKMQVGKTITQIAGGISEGKDINELLYTARDSLKGNAGSFTFYTNDSTIVGGSKSAVTHTQNTMLQAIGMPNMDLSEMMDYSEEKLINYLNQSYSKYGMNYIKYRLPFLKAFNIGGFADGGTVDKLWEIEDKDNNIKLMHLGDLFFGEKDRKPKAEKERKEFPLYLYTLMTNGNIYDRKDKKQDWFSDMRAMVKDKEGYIINSLQWKEDFFMQEAFNHIKKGDKDKFMKQFQDGGTTAEKFFTQLQVLEKAGSPGSAKKILGQFLSNQWYNEMINNNMDFKSTEDMNLIRSELGKKYGGLLYITDKPSWSDAELYYMRANYPETHAILSNPKDDKGHFHSINLTYEQTSGQKKNSEDPKNNPILKEIYQTEMYIDAMTYNGNFNAYKMANSVTRIRGKKGIDKGNPEYTKVKFATFSNMINKIKGMSISKQEQDTMITGLLTTVGSDIVKISKDKELQKTIGKPYEDLAYFLYGNLKDTEHRKEELAIEDGIDSKLNKTSKGDYTKKISGKKESKDYNYKKRLGYYNTDYAKNYKQLERMNYSIQNILRDMTKNFRPNNNYGKPFYSTNTYSKKDRDYLTDVGKARASFYSQFRNLGKQYGGGNKPFKQGATRASQQKSGFAVPPRLREMPRIYKDTDRTLQGTIKQTRKKSAVKYDPGRARSSVIKGSGSSPAIEKRTKGSSSSRSKGGHSSGSKNKTKHSKRSK